jgi:phospholipid/cholesterol/gamma-HCH transport system ATP-binding protein
MAEQTQASPVLLSVEHVSKSFGSNVVLDDISLVVNEGETLTVLGKSGTGKSVLLKLMSGLLTPDRGAILFRGRNIVEMNEHELADVRKHLGFLFQGSALFDSMTVGENLEMFLIRHTQFSAEEREEKIQRSLELVGLKDVIDKMPSELSGGMKKRAGLARSIVIEPELILYDEPTTGLDPVTAETIAELIVSMQFRLDVASVVVTHDLPMAYVVTDRAIMLNDSHIIYDGEIEGMKDSTDPFLISFLDAASTTRERRGKLLEKLSGANETTNKRILRSTRLSQKGS